VYAVAVAGERPARPGWLLPPPGGRGGGGEEKEENEEHEEAWQLVERCWSAEPRLRPRATEVAEELERMLLLLLARQQQDEEEKEEV